MFQSRNVEASKYQMAVIVVDTYDRQGNDGKDKIQRPNLLVAGNMKQWQYEIYYWRI